MKAPHIPFSFPAVFLVWAILGFFSPATFATPTPLNEPKFEPGSSFYANLGLIPDAPEWKDAQQAEQYINRAYRALALKYHPDTGEQTPENLSRFKMIAEAYETLKDPQKKLFYDALGGYHRAQKTRKPFNRDIRPSDPKAILEALHDGFHEEFDRKFAENIFSSKPRSRQEIYREVLAQYIHYRGSSLHYGRELVSHLFGIGAPIDNDHQRQALRQFIEESIHPFTASAPTHQDVLKFTSEIAQEFPDLNLRIWESALRNQLNPFQRERILGEFANAVLQQETPPAEDVKTIKELLMNVHTEESSSIGQTFSRIVLAQLQRDLDSSSLKPRAAPMKNLLVNSANILKEIGPEETMRFLQGVAKAINWQSAYPQNDTLDSKYFRARQYNHEYTNTVEGCFTGTCRETIEAHPTDEIIDMMLNDYHFSSIMQEHFTASGERGSNARCSAAYEHLVRRKMGPTALPPPP